MIIRQNDLPTTWTTDEPNRHGQFSSQRISEIGGLTQFGAYIESLQPGSRSSNRHWHEKEDEFLYMLSGEATVFDNDGAHRLLPGDAACWPAATASQYL